MREVNKQWWRGCVIYQIYPRSYADKNGDGIGDLAGIIEKLPYIASLGVDAIWLSPFYPSPMKDFGYDVQDYCDVDPMFGDLQEAYRLIEKAHELGIKVLIDLVLSHTSDKHPWFIESSASRENDKADWYVWSNPKEDGTPPNNWLSIFGGSAWQWHAGRRQYYLHNFLASQPDLNFHNERVCKEMLAVARFWLEAGVDGFRLDTVNMYTHDKLLRDNPPATAKTKVNGIPDENPYAMQQTIYNINRPENLLFIERLRALMDEFGQTTTVGELGAVADVPKAMREYTGDKRLHMAYSFALMHKQHEATFIREQVEKIDEKCWANWALSNHDVMRVMSRWELEDTPQAAVTLIALMTTLRGSSCLYQGEELGLPEATVPYEALQDPYGIEFWPEFKGRDGCRTPMVWSDAPDHGFGSLEAWLPHDSAQTPYAVSLQDKQFNSTLNRVRRFLNWRKKQAVLRYGDMMFLEGYAKDLLVFERTLEQEKVRCIFNLSNQMHEIVLQDNEQLLSVSGFEQLDQQLEKTQIQIAPWQAVFIGIV